MDTEETEGYVLQRRPYSVRSRDCVMFGVTETRGGERHKKKNSRHLTTWRLVFSRSDV